MIKEAIIFLGPPGCGKGTQARLLHEDFGIPLIGMGDLLRKEISNKTTYGNQLKNFVDRGEMPPWKMVRGILEAFIQEVEYPLAIFDGVPRNYDQVKDIQTLFDQRKIRILRVFHLHVPRQELERRIIERYSCTACGMIYSKKVAPAIPGICDLCHGTQFEARKDDRKSIIVRRLDIYDRDIDPVIRYYKEKNVLHTLDGSLPVKEIHSIITKNILLSSDYLYEKRKEEKKA